MSRDNTPWAPATPANIVWREDDLPHSTQFDDLYYSNEDGLAESRYVFVDGCDLRERWQRHRGRHYCIAETGFGSGLNFLATWDAWASLPDAPALHYIAFEQYPLRREDLHRALERWSPLKALADALLSHYPGLLPGQHRLHFANGRITLDLHWGEAGEAIGDLQQGRPLVDSWFLDGFAPSRNASMWRSELFTHMGNLSRPNANFTTFTAAGAVRRGLQDAGFDVVKRAGFGRKRECLQGTYTAKRSADNGEQRSATTPTPSITPWDLKGNSEPLPQDVVILGAGLAGSAVAAALADRGLRVTVLERDAIANGASANLQGVLYTRLSTTHSTLSDFALQSFRHASQHYRDLFAQGQLLSGTDGMLCGAFLQGRNVSDWQTLAERLRSVPEFAQALDATQANERLGIEQHEAGYWLPQSGWLHPQRVCAALLDHPNITVSDHCGELTLQRAGDEWFVQRQPNEGIAQTIATAQCVVIATGENSTRFEPLEWLPLRTVRGQTSLLPETALTQPLKAAFCHHGYIAPARQGKHCIGASFVPNDAMLEERVEEHRENLNHLAHAIPVWEASLRALDVHRLEGKVRQRCATPDYLPIAGAVPNYRGFTTRYAALRKDASQIIDQPGDYWPGLYVTTGHGSRGLTSTPLCAQVIASLICHEAAPISRRLTRAISPARFIIRDLSRNRI